MRHLVPAPFALALCLPLAAQEPDKPVLEFAVDGEFVTLAIRKPGVSVADFVKVAQQISGRTLRYARADVQGAGPITLIGRKRVHKDRFYPFFLSVLQMHGLVTTLSIGKAGDAIRIVPARPRPGEVWVDPADLANHPDQPGVRLVTAVALGKLPVAEALRRLRAVEIVDLEVTALGPAADALMLRGVAPQLRTACRVLEEAPVVEGKATSRVIRLRHASAKEVADTVNTLIGKGIGVPANRVLLKPHAATNAILVRGLDKKQVDQVVTIIQKLDQPARGKKKG